MGDEGAGGGVGGPEASGAGAASVGAGASSGGGVGGSGAGASVPVAGGGLGPFCPVSLAASVRGEGMLSVSELLLIVAVWGEQRGRERCGDPGLEAHVAFPCHLTGSGQELRRQRPRRPTPNCPEAPTTLAAVRCCAIIIVTITRQRQAGPVTSEEPGEAAPTDRTHPGPVPAGPGTPRCTVRDERTTMKDKDTLTPGLALLSFKKNLVSHLWVSIPPPFSIKTPHLLLGNQTR